MVVAALAGESHLVIGLERSALRLVAFIRRARITEVLSEVAHLAPAARVQLAGLAVIAAVAAHAIALAAAGVRLQTAGWSWCVGLTLLGLLAFFSPELLVSAWSDRFRRNRNN